MYKCIKAFQTSRMRNYCYGQPITSFDYFNLLPIEQKHFVPYDEGAKFSTAAFTQADNFLDLGNYDTPAQDTDAGYFDGFGGGDSGGGGAQGDY